MTLSMLFHKYQRAILAALFETPHESLSINELARRSGVDPGNTKRYVEKFAQAGFVTLTHKGNAVLVNPDLSNEETRKVFELYEITRTNNFLIENKPIGKMLKELATSLYENLPEVRLVCLFGPSAQALSTSCPIELAIIVGAGLDTKETARLAEDVIKRFGLPYETKLSVHGTSEISAMWKTGEDLCVEIWGTRIVLFGEGFFWRTIAKDGVPIVAEERIGKGGGLADNA